MDIKGNNCVRWVYSYELIINCFWGMDDRREALSLISSRNYCQVLTITYLCHPERRILTCADPAFGIIWMKLCSIDNHYTSSNFTQFWKPGSWFALQPWIWGNLSQLLGIKARKCEVHSKQVYIFRIKGGKRYFRTTLWLSFFIIQRHIFVLNNAICF